MAPLMPAGPKSVIQQLRLDAAPSARTDARPPAAALVRVLALSPDPTARGGGLGDEAPLRAGHRHDAGPAGGAGVRGGGVWGRIRWHRTPDAGRLVAHSGQ